MPACISGAREAAMAIMLSMASATSRWGPTKSLPLFT